MPEAPAQPALPELPSSVTRVALEGKTVWLVGTAHVSKQSVRDASETVAAVRPAAVAIDILYEGESGTAGDAQLAAAAEKLGCVVTASMAEYGEIITWEDGHAVERNASAVVNYVEPYDALKDVTVQGHINAMNDMDGILRHAMLYVTTPEGNQVLSMAATTAKMYD